MGKYYGYSHKSTEMNDWIRTTLKAPEYGMVVTDFDFIFFEYNLKRLRLLEVKTFNAKVKKWQLEIFRIIDFALKNMNKLDEIGDFKYDGLYILTLDTSSPKTAGKMNINGIEISYNNLIKFLNFEKEFADL